MFAVVRRRVASSSLLKIRSGTTRVSSILEKEIALNSGGCASIRNFCHITPGRWISSKPIRDIFHQEASIQTWKRSFSSDNGDNVDVVVPPLAEWTLAKFLKRPGDRVNVDEPIAQIETDKVTTDVPSPESGVILKLLANEGDTVAPGNKIAIISRSADATTHVAPSETAPEKPAPKPTPKASEPEEKKTPKVETTTTEKPKAPAPQSSPTEPQLPFPLSVSILLLCFFCLFPSNFLFISHLFFQLSSFLLYCFSPLCFFVYLLFYFFVQLFFFCFNFLFSPFLFFIFFLFQSNDQDE